MPYSRQRPRLAPTSRVTVRFTTAQRDQFLASADVPRALAHELHRAPVRAGKLTLRVTLASLEALIAAAARHPTTDRRDDRAQAALLRYLESLEDRFTSPEEDEPPAEPPEAATR